MNIVVVEDEPLVARNLEKLIGILAPDFIISVKLTSVEESVQWFESNPSPDLIFMDIQLSDGISFDIFKKVTLDCPIIFTTAYNEYALRAFKVNSVDYLLKPIDKDELTSAIAKFRKWKEVRSNWNIQDQLYQLITDIKKPIEAKKYKERFLVWHKNAVLPIEQSSVSYIFKEELIYLKTMDWQKFITDFDTMEQVEEVLNPVLFFRANRQALIHIQSVENYRPAQNGKVIVKLKAPISSELEISREKAGALKSWLS
ncbi:MAG: response regulator transcription factor [Cytophagales bacterium]|nr:response regulator transcription factor [Cytophagales bacterium]